MPIIPQQQTIVQYVTNASQTQYTFAFYAPLPTDIQVYYQAANAVPIPSADILAINSQYTVTYNADPTTGGYITLLFTPTTGYYLTINRMVQASLTTNFSNAQNFNGANLDAVLDRLLLLIQQNLNYITERNLSYVINTYLPNATPYTQLPPLPQNYFWVGSGAGVVAAQIATVPSASVLQSMLSNNSPGTDGARIVGYYDTILSHPTTVDAILTSLNTSVTNLNLKSFSFINFQVLTGTGTYTPTPGTKFGWARGIGQGGGGGGCTSSAAQIGIGAGGAAGAYGESWFTAASIPYSCGNIGNGGGAGIAGTAGASTTFGSAGSILNLSGGGGGESFNHQTATTGITDGSTGGSVVTANFGTNGENSYPAIWFSLTKGIAGGGANSKLGAGALALATGAPGGTNGLAGSGYGAGGGGAITIGAANAVGGNGSQGVIIVFEFG